jgi:hypothetical protein
MFTSFVDEQEAAVLNMLSLSGAILLLLLLLSSPQQPPPTPPMRHSHPPRPPEHLRSCASAATHASLYARIAAPSTGSSDSLSAQLYEACGRAHYTSSVLLSMCAAPETTTPNL